ncbi:MAG TPA: hypothetical protein VMC79_14090 [Rectinemataceae bacterium]|nr:hypothetical protein [Rectinemataceae bacterium]
MGTEGRKKAEASSADRTGIEARGMESELAVAANLAYLSLDQRERRSFAESVAKMLEFFAVMDGFEAGLSSPSGDPATGAAADMVPAGRAGENRTARGVMPEPRSDAVTAFADSELFRQASSTEGRFVSIPNIL